MVITIRQGIHISEQLCYADEFAWNTQQAYVTSASVIYAREMGDPR